MSDPNTQHPSPRFNSWLVVLIEPAVWPRLRHASLAVVVATMLLAAEFGQVSVVWLLLGLGGAILALVLSLDPRWLYRPAYPGLVVLTASLVVPLVFSAFVMILVGASGLAVALVLLAWTVMLLLPEEGSRWIERRSRRDVASRRG